MTGLYIHIPFCRKACYYCDFYFTVSLKYKEEFIRALLAEIESKAQRSTDRKIHSVYFGGGTPSVLERKDFDRILSAVEKHFSLQSGLEKTLEANPDDLDDTRLEVLKKMGFNRLSIGIQSFIERDLILMNRSHSLQQALDCIPAAHVHGFTNINIDLIYGIPGQSSTEWQENLHRATAFPVSHLSAYHLTFEPKTVFDHWRKKGRIQPVKDQDSLEQYKILRDTMMKKGYDHYEISNFAREGQYSGHNLIYWNGSSYEGLGPSAHSYDGERRYWNAPSLRKYLDHYLNNIPSDGSEWLSPVEKYHDYIITSLRTKWGAERNFIRTAFGKEIHHHFTSCIQELEKTGELEVTEDRVRIPPEKWIVADGIMRSLFMD